MKNNCLKANGKTMICITYDRTTQKIRIITSFTARLYGRRRSKRMTEKIIENAKKE